ncbi:TPA: aspartyl-tRNA amidotransferase [candidate division CPR2 bacterium]|uniref:GatB/YqeY domain-containing protein n=1 Tax=candidate division CPR2 bacterium GW2011_GWC1_41_48 TaxID=1618344 RepID=A0A0G0WC75_UNCC2|nr:MAG: hypothetical protein UT47_C0001G0057 [candidate division CPR2 bacterium GW2011_GWC2_39_35]KKR29497.1 MAG: hypothetical protein UT60_C0001G0033 [candidate division CPR2 bacterium GW2011_GWD2_39_7]KKR29722.1 MAG: hypothetical protein UT59_C0001G0031 [candidate division CPR2 bacterium GW2011_GWD1_39_7]KKS09652.1 MAG: hypothetical protein UU65_C0001G0057 [candidate division CPR2 bacterium GW2011_GWC1_41_48]HBG81447.1 aspartyl-tRNA amidotransferase [candidate division CPR2 bacterium]
MLVDKINIELKEALKNRREKELSVLRLIKSALKNEEISKKHPLSEEEAIYILDRQAKQREDAILAYEKAGRTDLAEKEQQELLIISKYRPKKMGEDEVIAEVKKVLEGLGASDFGQAMKQVMSELKGKADGRLVSEIVKAEFNKK